ncbi:copper homeostasis protein CutF [Dickeya dianthicola]|uniref:Copper homeostasis protein CutF n=1 Tax=Dickeya dianthicola TaxID=204039 RepID=A0ABX9NPX8_9GAMM|nr:copper resistance protein NlpE N-terminal domain-containing protein [Dickeya dianthicola]MBT1427089.1 copper resistance protein NlpE N-terminal domain-containing protein [Dickeya dianthicola]MBT1458608.1 copper resistance protein NlpE N-terminal domain-containing protein [Dickeya dianthicola]MBT1487806.1 copper resistance protein NlpE N-terminal domain-containing protein [Dickeya dianthicola]MCI4031392.1 copper resistance protein NlpE N-terminal domain-containing protein [Dickeya dianthicola
MKKLAIGVVLVVLLSGLMGCHSRPQIQEESLRPMAQYYRGKLPCGACGEMDTTLFLNTDGSFVMQESYPSGADGNTTVAESGRWSRTAERLVLTDDYGEKRYFRPLNNDLEALGDDGQPLDAVTQRHRLLAVDKQDKLVAPACLSQFSGRDMRAVTAAIERYMARQPDGHVFSVTMEPESAAVRVSYYSYSRAIDYPIPVTL